MQAAVTLRSGAIEHEEIDAMLVMHLRQPRDGLLAC